MNPLIEYISNNDNWEAQIDALEGRVRVVATESGYEWIESPWNDGRNPRFTDINKYATWNVGE
jgi:hypothetical protein